MTHKDSEEQALEASIPPPQRPKDLAPKPKNKANYARLLESLQQISGKEMKMPAANNERSKYEFPNAPTPCDEGKIRGCKTACCTLYFELSAEDLADGFEYEPNMPYAIRHEEDGYCYLLDRETLQCSVWEKRPKTCRIFDCRKKSNFTHIWED